MDANSALAWEKTVEWNFVRKYLGKYDFGAPIDGDREISDAVLAKAERWQLVEFKFSYESCSAERRKYPYTSRDRTVMVLKSQLKGLDRTIREAATKQINADIYLNRNKDWNGQGPAWDYYVNSEKKNLNRPKSFLEESKSKFLYLLNKYSTAPMEGDILEPHFFVYADNNDFNSLLAYPYWTDWIEKNSRILRNWNEFDANLLTNYGTDKKTFDAYILDLATTRGYDLQTESTSGSSECIVLGNITGFSGSKGIARTLNQYLTKLNKPKPSVAINPPGPSP
jgi:hypothetical protein